MFKKSVEDNPTSDRPTNKSNLLSVEAVGTGNAIAALSLNRLGYLAGRQDYIDAAERCLKSAWRSINNHPISHCAFLNALNEYLAPADILIIRSQASNKEDWEAISQQHYLASTMVYTIPAEETLHDSLAQKAAGKTSIAYPCSGLQCQQPLENLTELQTYLRNNSYRVLEYID